MEIAARGAYRAQLTKLVKAVTELLNSEGSRVDGKSTAELESLEDEIISLGERLNGVSASLKTADQQIQNKKLIKEEDLERDCEKMAEYEDSAVSVMVGLKNRLKRVQAKLNSSDECSEKTVEGSQRSSVKLPKLELKKFGGEPQDWLPFWDQFHKAVHQNASLAAADKFQYLENCLYGSAKRTVSGFTASASCYDAAISLLLEQYGNTDKLIDTYMQKLLNVRPVTSKIDCTGLRMLYNTVTTCTRSLTALHTPPSQYQIMLKSILLRCLPADLRVEYHRSINKETQPDDECVTEQEEKKTQSSLCGVTDPYVQDIMKFLKKEVEALEKSNMHTSTCVNKKQTSSPTTAASLIGLNTKDVCVFCSSADHTTKDCKNGMTLKEKRDKLLKTNRCSRCAKVGHSSKKCRSGKFIKCDGCGGRHITSMCDPSYNKNSSVSALAQTGYNLCAHTLNFKNVFLKTARCVAARILVLPFGSKEKQPSKEYSVVHVKLRSQYSDRSVVIKAIVVPDICVDVLKAPDSSNGLFRKIKLADKVCVNIQSVNGLSLLIGSDYYWTVVTGKQRSVSNRLKAVETIFGWTLQGYLGDGEMLSSKLEYTPIVSSVMSVTSISDNELSKMWALETIGIRGEEAEKMHVTEAMTRECIKKVGCRYEAVLPWKNPQMVSGNNRELAVSRSTNLTKRLSRDPDKLREYDAAVRQLVNDGIAEAAASTSTRVVYLPHRPVYKEESATTKLRIVFDASASTKQSPSLNDQLFTGTNLLPNVFSILLNFRLGPVGIVADIEKAFLQISLNKSDRDAHRFLWYRSLAESDMEIQELRMTRVTFGVCCSPFILTATIKHHLQEEERRFPGTCRLLEKSFYVDDMVTSVDSDSEAVKFYSESKDIMGKASMNLRKWYSNSPAVRAAVGSSNFPISQKVLGLNWSAFNDELSVPLDSIQNFLQTNMFRGTKRNILQAIARVYDPLGMVAPTIIKLKILFQASWRRKLAWDEVLPDALMLLWNECVNNVLQLKDMSIPRAVQIVSSCPIYCHIFADASKQAYGAVVYVQAVNVHGEVVTSFLCAKSRVAPLKHDREDELTLPKLELTAALIASRLCAYLRNQLRVAINKFFLWTDSKITLNWIYGETQRWKPYVQSRVLEIRRNSKLIDWRHCSGKDNPADLITRGISGSKLATSLLWERGPDWLNDIQTFNNSQHCNEASEVSVTFLLETDDVASNEELPIFCCERFNSWQRLLRVTCWVLRFIKNCKLKQKSLTSCLTKSEYDSAELYWIRYVQKLSFSNDLSYLQKGKPMKKSSKIAQLSPVLDEERLLRVGGRLQMLEDDNDVIHSIILPSNHHITAIIVDEYHLLTCHGGTILVLTKLRSRFWILRGRQLIKRRIRRCIVCKKLFGPPATQPFAALPLERITFTRPFDNVGIDFAGPLYFMKPEAGTMHKAYILIFTCAAVRAIHLELTEGMSTECCLMGLRRFIARRGVPSTILSDNAKTFRRASLELNSESKGIFSDDMILNFLSKRHIKWNFIVERAPWWGGFWERLIRTVKNTLKVVIGKARLTFEQLRTVLTEAEAVINDRPLTYVSDDPLDLTPLTPAKFIMGCKTPNPTSEHHHSRPDVRDLWKNRMKYTSRLSKRWQAEYLQLLRSFHHTTNNATATLRKGDIVLLFDPATPRVNWKMVIIEQTFLGRDGKIEHVKCAAQMVYIVGHIPPGSDERHVGSQQNGHTTFTESNNMRYLELIRKYSSIIQGQFFGHLHSDSFRIIYDDKGKPVSWMMISPSVTPRKMSVGSNNPAMRLYKFDTDSGQVLDYTQYYLDLALANTLGEPNWIPEYNLTHYYGLNDISAISLHNFVDRFTSNDGSWFAKYYRANTVRYQTDPCEGICMLNHYCAITRVDYKEFRQCLEKEQSALRSHTTAVHSCPLLILLLSVALSCHTAMRILPKYLHCCLQSFSITTVFLLQGFLLRILPRLQRTHQRCRHSLAPFNSNCAVKRNPFHPQIDFKDDTAHQLFQLIVRHTSVNTNAINPRGYIRTKAKLDSNEILQLPSESPLTVLPSSAQPSCAIIRWLLSPLSATIPVHDQWFFNCQKLYLTLVEIVRCNCIEIYLTIIKFGQRMCSRFVCSTSRRMQQYLTAPPTAVL